MRGPAIAGLLREDLVHGAPREPAAKHRIDRVMIERRVIVGFGARRMRLTARFPESLHRSPQNPSRPQLREILCGR